MGTLSAVKFVFVDISDVEILILLVPPVLKLRVSAALLYIPVLVSVTQEYVGFVALVSVLSHKTAHAPGSNRKAV
jgi:hypothetical protein